MDIPSTLPVMLLSECCLLPHGMLPLFIFEPRYRAMVRYALENDRMMCIGTLTFDAERDEDIFEYTTGAVIRASISNDDGTSRLILQGAERLRIVDWKQREPFRIAEMERIPSTISPEADCRSLQGELLDLVAQYEKNSQSLELIRRLRKLSDPGQLADMVAAHFLPETDLRLPLLSMRASDERLRYLIKVLTIPF